VAARAAVRTEILITVTTLAVIAAMGWLTATIWWSLVIDWWLWIFFFRERVRDRQRYVGAEYVIDERGVRAVDRGLKCYWGPVVEQVGWIQVEILPGCTNVTWQPPVKTRRGSLLPPRDGLYFVKAADSRAMCEALEGWVALAEARVASVP